ncbi:CinA family protein [Legionella saoudiensis]|uniref:CinA family protein n=1 Tax=Legionella saoudiensis TaxID=1750561 RepID=UPI000730B911|nr:nicotinamide-nucleotide amidohydrolase family protein [Legionella saoudiensis]
MSTYELKELVSFLKKNHLKLSTAESCTGGCIAHLLSKVPKSGEILDTGFVVYSAMAKEKVLGVKKSTIEQFNLTSEEVAREMVQGAYKLSNSNVIIATTGLVGSKSIDGITPGTVCFSWLFSRENQTFLFSETAIFSGSKPHKQMLAALHALERIPFYFNSIQG